METIRIEAWKTLRMTQVIFCLESMETESLLVGKDEQILWLGNTEILPSSFSPFQIPIPHGSCRNNSYSVDHVGARLSHAQDLRRLTASDAHVCDFQSSQNPKAEHATPICTFVALFQSFAQ